MEEKGLDVCVICGYTAEWKGQAAGQTLAWCHDCMGYRQQLFRDPKWQIVHIDLPLCSPWAVMKERDQLIAQQKRLTGSLRAEAATWKRRAVAMEVEARRTCRLLRSAEEDVEKLTRALGRARDRLDPDGLGDSGGEEVEREREEPGWPREIPLGLHWIHRGNDSYDLEFASRGGDVLGVRMVLGTGVEIGDVALVPYEFLLENGYGIVADIEGAPVGYMLGHAREFFLIPAGTTPRTSSGRRSHETRTQRERERERREKR